MRTLGLSLLLSCGVLACTSDTAPVVYVGMSYQVRCLDCQPRAQDDAARNIKAVDDEAGYKLSCAVDSMTGTKRVTVDIVHESANSEQSYSLSVSNASLAEESDGPCSVRVVEGANTYQGACGSAEPNEDRPCQVSFEVKRGVLKGSLYCKEIASDASSSLTRYLVAPITRDPATFEIYGCSGL